MIGGLNFYQGSAETASCHFEFVPLSVAMPGQRLTCCAAAQENGSEERGHMDIILDDRRWCENMAISNRAMLAALSYIPAFSTNQRLCAAA